MTVASFHLAYFPLKRSLSRFLVVPAERWEINEADGCRLGKVMGTSKEGTTKTSVDFRRWALLAVWDSPEQRDAFLENSALMTRWRKNAFSLRSYSLEPISSHGTWNGDALFPDIPSTRTEVDSPVAVLTRAAVRWRKIWTFTRSIKPSDDALKGNPDLQLALGMGEWPVGEQATFSIWNNAQAINDYAYKTQAHQDVIRRRKDEQWYSEELFVRFAVTEL